VMAYRSYLKRNPVERSLEQEVEFVDNVEKLVLEQDLKYKGNQLQNGSSPFDLVYGEGKYSDTDNTLRIKNQSGSDVVVFLKRIDNGEIIRNHYVRAGTSHTFTKIPNVTCFTKFYYGEDWNPARKVRNVIVGGFDTNEQFVDTEQDLMEFKEYEDDKYFYSSQYEITLETIIIEGEAMHEKKVAASEFF
jgi:hypothetical protein